MGCGGDDGARDQGSPCRGSRPSPVPTALRHRMLLPGAVVRTRIGGRAGAGPQGRAGSPQRGGPEWTAVMEAHRITHGPELISTIPATLGYIPRDSLVLATAETSASATGTGWREAILGPCLRLDFGAEDIAGFGPGLVKAVVGQLARVDDIDTIFPVIFSDALARFHLAWEEPRPSDGGELVHIADVTDVLARVTESLEGLGLRVFPALWSGCGASGALRCPEATLRDAAIDTAAVQAVVAESFEACVRDPEADPVVRASVDALRREDFALSECADALLAEALLLDARTRTREEGPPPEAPVVPDPLAVLAVERLCRRGRDRDIIQMLLAGDHPDFDTDVLRGLDAGEFLGYARVCVGLGAAAQIVGLSPRRPRHAALSEAVDWLRMCAVHVSADALVEVLALIAWFEWARGRMSFALHYADRAVAEQEDHRMASMILRAVEHGIPPRWLSAD